MTDCRNCRRDTDLFLCTLCAKEVHALLADLPWLLRQLDITVTRQDKLNLGVLGRSGNASPSPINIGAMELARNLRNQLSTIVRDLAETNYQKLPADHTPAMAQWLYEHINEIACSPDAGHIVREIRGGTEAILGTINRSSRMWCGPCTTVVGHNRRGADIECGVDLYAQRDHIGDIQCPRCRQVVNPREQLLTTIKRGDRLPEPKLLEIMESLGEKVSRVRFYDWVREGSIKPSGYIHHGRIVPQRIQRGDPALYSLSQARQLRWRDSQEAA
jgi:hypothetical protein